MLLLLILISPLPSGVHRAASGLGLLVGGVSVAWACSYQARRSQESRRTRAWTLFGLAAVIGTLGNIWLLIAGSSMGPDSGVSTADICLVLALIIGVSATIAFPSTPRRPAEVMRIVMDGVVIGGSLLFLASVTLFPQIVGPEGDLANRALPLLVPVIDVVVATTALLLFLRRTSADGNFLGLVSVGFALFSISDFSSAIVTVSGPFAFGTPVDIPWIAGYLVIALAVGGAGFGHQVLVDRHREGSAVAGTTVMFTVFFVAAAASLRLNQAGTLSTVSAVLWVLVLVGVVGRQVTLIVDNERLRRGLEQRVIKGSRDLRALSQRTDLLVNSVADGIYGVDRDGRVTFVNPLAARTLGFLPEELIGRHAHETFHAPQPSGRPFPEPQCYISEAIARGSVTTAEEDAYVRADGQLIPVEVTASPTTDDGRPIGAVVVFRDITGRREVDRLKNEFVSIVSHELRTPLTSIRGAIGLVESGSLGAQSPQAQRMLTIALEGSIRLGRLINDILDVERIHSGVMPMAVAEYRVVDLVESSVSQVRVLADRAGVAIDVTSVEGFVFTDRDRTEQTLINLLDNAIKFSPPQSAVRVHTEAVGSLIEFVVSDVGRGVPPDKLTSIFQRFEQVDSSDARDRGGTGLGLAISRSIIERLGGRIWAENNPGGGATFRFTLPRAGMPASNDDRVLLEEPSY